MDESTEDHPALDILGEALTAFMYAGGVDLVNTNGAAMAVCGPLLLTVKLNPTPPFPCP